MGVVVDTGGKGVKGVKSDLPFKLIPVFFRYQSGPFQNN